MAKQRRSHSGQSILSEQMMIFFIVIGVVVAVTVYVQRTFKARIHDAQDFMINSVADNNVCDANCLMATGNKISNEYEPYYQQLTAQSQMQREQDLTAAQGNANVIGAVYRKFFNQEIQTSSFSNQLPPELAQ